MKWKKIGRVFVCLVLICCILVNLSPLKAKATGAGLAANLVSAGTFTISAPVAIAAGLIVLGIMVGTNDDFQRVVSNAVSSLTNWVKDGTVEVFQTVNSDGKKTYYLPGDMLEDLRSFCISQEVISSKELVLDTVMYPPADALAIAEAAPYSILVYVYNASSDLLSYDLLYSYDSSFRVETPLADGKGVYIYLNDGGTCYHYSHALCAWYERTGTLIVQSNSSKEVISAQEFGALAAKYSTSYDLSLGQVSSVPVDGTSAREWSEEYTDRGLYVVGGPGGDNNNDDGSDGKWFWPVALTLTAAELYAMSQYEQWTAETPAEFDDCAEVEEYNIISIPDVEFGSAVELAPVDDTNTGAGTGTGTGSDVNTDYSSWFSKVYTVLENIWSSVLELPSKFATWFDDILSAIQELPSKFAEWFNTISTKLERIWESLCNLPQSIANAIALIFVPSEDFLTEKVEALRDEFCFADSLITTGEYIADSLTGLGTEPPVIYIHLEDTRGSYNIGGTVPFLDLRWYSEYKPVGDAIISAFLWLMFVWGLYIKAPGIIRGIPGDFRVFRNLSGKD